MREAARSKKILLLLAWTLFGLFMALQTYIISARLQQPLSWRYALGSEMLYAYLWLLLTPQVLRFSRKFSLERSRLLRRLAIHLALGLVTALVHRALFGFALATYRYVFEGATLSWQRWLTHTLSYLDYGILIYGLILIVEHALQYHQRYHAKLLQTEQLQTQLAHAQLQALKMQLHPHFLFNTLNAVSVLIAKRPEAARETLRKLSELLRLTLENAGTQLVPLQTELEFLQRYLQIEQIRFEDRLNVYIDVAAEALPVLVPNFILQPLVENAIRHGVMAQRGPARLEITARRDNGGLRLEVRDNGKGFAENGAHTGIGLQNTRMRLEKLYGERSRFSLINAENGGVIARIEIPVEASADQS